MDLPRRKSSGPRLTSRGVVVSCGADGARTWSDIASSWDEAKNGASGGGPARPVSGRCRWAPQRGAARSVSPRIRREDIRRNRGRDVRKVGWHDSDWEIFVPRRSLAIRTHESAGPSPGTRPGSSRVPRPARRWGSVPATGRDPAWQTGGAPRKPATNCHGLPLWATRLGATPIRANPSVRRCGPLGPGSRTEVMIFLAGVIFLSPAPRNWFGYWGGGGSGRASSVRPARREARPPGGIPGLSSVARYSGLPPGADP